MDKNEAKQRVQIELAELNDKITKLSAFLFSEKALSVTHNMRYVMEQQLHHMTGYANALQTRLELWDKPEDPDDGPKMCL